MYYWKWSQFWKKWESRNCVFRMDRLWLQWGIKVALIRIKISNLLVPNKLYCNQLTMLPVSCKEAIFYLLPINRSIFTLEMQMAWQWLSHFTTERERSEGKDTIGLNQFGNKIATAKNYVQTKIFSKMYRQRTFGCHIWSKLFRFLSFPSFTSFGVHSPGYGRRMIIEESREIKGI